MLDVKRRGQDVRKFVQDLETWAIETLKMFGVVGELREDRIGVWVRRADTSPEREDKIAAIGIRLRKWVSFHGISLNVSPDLDHFTGICALRHHRARGDQSGRPGYAYRDGGRR